MPSGEPPEGTFIDSQSRPPLVARRIVDFQPTAHPKLAFLNWTLVRFVRTPAVESLHAPVAKSRLRKRPPLPTTTAAVDEKPTASGLTVCWENSCDQVAPPSVLWSTKPSQSYTLSVCPVA